MYSVHFAASEIIDDHPAVAALPQINTTQLLAKVPVFKCQKMALRAPQSKNGVQKPRETPPKMVG